MRSYGLAWTTLLVVLIAGCGGGGNSTSTNGSSSSSTPQGTNAVAIDSAVPASATAAITTIISGAESVSASATSINLPLGLSPEPALVLAIDSKNNILLIGSPTQDGSITLSVASTSQALAEFGLEPLPSGVTYAQAISAISGSAGYNNLVTQVGQALNSDMPPVKSPAVLTALSAVAAQAQTALLSALQAKGSGYAPRATSKYNGRPVAQSATYQPLPDNLVTASNGAYAIVVADDPATVNVQLYNNTFIQWMTTTTDINGNSISSTTLPPLSVGSYLGNVVTTGKASTPVPVNGNSVQFVVTVSEDSQSVAFNISNLIQSATNITLSKITTLTGQQKTCVGTTITTLVNGELPALLNNPGVESFEDYVLGVFKDADDLIAKCAFSAAETEEFGPLSAAVAAVQTAVNVSSFSTALTQAVSWLGQSFAVEVCKSSGVSVPCALAIRTPNPFLAVGQSEQLTALLAANTQPFLDQSAFTWATPNTAAAIATVSPLGEVTAGTMPGIANIQVMDVFGDVGTANITVGLPVVIPTSASTSVASTVQMSLVDPSNQPLTLTPPWQWYSNSPSIATIDQATGLVTGVAPGVATVYAQDEVTHDTTYPAQITVAPYSSETSVTPDPPSVPANGEPVTFTATVSSSIAPAGAPAPTGTVTFTDTTSNTPLCSRYQLSNGSAVCPNVTVMAGDTVLATYSGDPNYAPSTGEVTVGGMYVTTTMLVANPTGVPAGGAEVTFTATVDGSSAPAGTPAPTGTVTFKDLTSGIGLCSDRPLSGGSAQCPNTLGLPGDVVQATYSGDPNYSSSSDTVTLSEVNVSLTASQPSVTVGTAVTLMWTSTGMASCTESGGSSGDGWAGIAPSVNGSQSVSESAAGIYTYTMTCTSTDGATQASASVTVSVTANPWVGTWVGTLYTTTAACGGPSSVPWDVSITSAGNNAIYVSYQGLTLYETLSENGAVASLYDDTGTYLIYILTLSGNTITLTNYSDPCQLGTLTRQ